MLLPRNPGPKYNLSNMTHRGPVAIIGASLASKHKVIRTERTPGPAAYNTVPCMSVTLPAIQSCFIGYGFYTSTHRNVQYCLFVTDPVGGLSVVLPTTRSSWVLQRPRCIIIPRYF
ncbi:hypothetical protein QTP88_029226 [Uroleucon formosanum]